MHAGPRVREFDEYMHIKMVTTLLHGWAWSGHTVYSILIIRHRALRKPLVYGVQCFRYGLSTKLYEDNTYSILCCYCTLLQIADSLEILPDVSCFL